MAYGLKEKLEQTEDYKRYKESGDNLEVCQLVSMAYLTYSIANQYAEEANDILAKYGMSVKKIKTTANNLRQSFDAYDKCMAALFDTEDVRRDLCEDYEILKETTDLFLSLPNRVAAKQAMQDDNIRAEGLYVCEVRGTTTTDFLLLAWKGGEWHKVTERKGLTGMGKVTIKEVMCRVYEAKVGGETIERNPEIESIIK